MNGNCKLKNEARVTAPDTPRAAGVRKFPFFKFHFSIFNLSLLLAALVWVAAPWPARAVDTSALRRKQDAQERARDMARQLVSGILEVQLQQLEVVEAELEFEFHRSRGVIFCAGDAAQREAGACACQRF